jgi:predicted flap endonuclease-1-like 5' DNA nuclease
MATNLLWYVMAGFLLGFATSTLWEWFYFRRERLKLTERRIRELEAKVHDADVEAGGISTTSAQSTNPLPTIASVTAGQTRTSAWGDTAYRRPAVFLEGEEYELDGAEYHSSGQDRTRPAIAPAATNPPVGPTVNSVTPPTTPATASNAVPPGAPAPSADPTVVPRTEPPSPADALRAKRVPSARTRQEVLAALRRNSEAVQRGQPLSPATDEDTPEESIPPYAPPASTLVTPTPLVNHEPPVAPPPQAQPAPVSTPPPAVSPARQRWFNNPELTNRTQEYPDDLSKIKGIGDVYKQRLYRAGIYTWKQIAEADSETLRRATSAYPSSNVEEWLTQAEKLMAKHGRQEAVYHGPQPDDMTRILGIGPVSAAVLYRAGICTYEQLATTAIAELEALFPVAVAGDLPDFGQWITRATTLADEKHADSYV